MAIVLSSRHLPLCAVLVLAAVAYAASAHATCDLIPGVQQAFRGTLATGDRPFAEPGAWVTLALDPTCHGASSGFSTALGDQVVTILFEPPQGARHVVVLATDCAAIEAERQACAAAPSVGSATCLDANQPAAPLDLAVPDASTLLLRFPDTDALLGLCVGGTNDGQPCTASADCPAGGTCTDGANDDLGFTGPATIAVSAAAQPLPCGLATGTCADESGLLACLDTLFVAEGDTCGTVPHATFAHFTALPPANDYQAICVDPVPPCTGTVDDLRFTIDVDGNVLLPMDMRGILVNFGEVPIARLLRGSTQAEAFEGSGQPMQLPDGSFLGSFTPSGAPLPPLFDPQLDPTTAAEVTLFGAADAPASVLRLARRSPRGLTCIGGGNDALPCAAATDCPAGTCGAAVCLGGGSAALPCTGDSDCPGGACVEGLFDFDARLLADVGPVLLRRGTCLGGTAAALSICDADSDCPGGQCVDFELAALDPVPLDGLNQSDVLNAFVMNEAIEDQDLNGDADALDDVVVLTDRVTGAPQPIGAGGALGRALARVRRPPFSFPALAVENDVIAFLELEPAQGNLDANADGDTFDTLLRAYRLDGTELTSAIAPLRSVDAAPLIDGRSIAVSDGRVFVRTSEAALAARATILASVDSAGVQGDDQSRLPALSTDGRSVAFDSIAGNLDPADTVASRDVFAHDLGGTTEIVSVDSSGIRQSGPSEGNASISADGRFVAFRSQSAIVPGSPSQHNVFVRDRVAGTTEIVNVDSAGAFANAQSTSLTSISADGMLVAFASDATNLVPDDTNGVPDIFVRDRLAGTTARVSLASDGTEPNNTSQQPALSADGRYVAFNGRGDNLVAGDIAGTDDIFVRDRATDTLEWISVAPDGTAGNSDSVAPAISADGRYVSFASRATNLVAGDTNDARDVFVHDRFLGLTERVSLTSAGLQGDAESVESSLSADGRFVAFVSEATNLVPDDTNSVRDVFVRDRLLGITERANLSTAGVEANAEAAAVVPSVSGDGRTVAMGLLASNLVTGDTNGQQDIFVRYSDPNDAGSDLFPDGDLDDVVLEVLDTTAPTPALQTLCPATAVTVAGGNAAFLRPEAGSGSASCPGGSLNADGDTADQVVHLWTGGASAASLGRAADALALSDTWLAALVSEADDNATVLNGDGDLDDAVMHVHAVGGGGWTNVGHAADVFDIAGGIVAFTTDETAQGAGSLNADGDADDRVLQLYDASTGQALLGAATTPRAQAAEDFVMGGAAGQELIAFRTRESAEGGLDLNDDGDALDDVLQVYDVASAQILNTGQAVTPCGFEACDPRVPYRVKQDTVTFLTLESEQAEDLNGDGDTSDLILQVFNARTAGGGAGEAPPSGARASTGAAATATRALAAVSAGVCTDTGKACAQDAACPTGLCFVPPGGCLRSLGVACDPQSPGSCGAGNFCEPTVGAPGQGTCVAVEGPCTSDIDCTLPAVCNDARQNVQRFLSPLTAPARTGPLFASVGRCEEDLGTPCAGEPDCAVTAFCGAAGTCRRAHGTCRHDSDCPPGAVCEPALVLATAADDDDDEITDPLDNCPTVANVAQADTDQDGVGDACEPAVCGNGTVEAGEACDDGNTTSGDGCDATCAIETGSCPPTPLVGCRAPAVATKASLQIKNREPDHRDRLVWKWIKGTTTTKSEFGDPLATDDYAFCLYDGSGLVVTATAPAGGTCREKPCWKDQKRGYKYRDRDLTPDGLASVQLKEGLEDGKAKILVKGRGELLPVPDLTALVSPVTAQLSGAGGLCWEAVFSAPFTKLDPTQFKDKAD